MKINFKFYPAIFVITVLGFTLVVLMLTGLGFLSVHAAGPWYVATNGDESNDCLSPATPCASINGALGKTSSGDTIYVAIGTYTGTGENVVLIEKNVTLSGGWDGTFTTQSGNSIIDGEEARRGILVKKPMSDELITNIEHFTIQNGYVGEEFTSGAGIGGGIKNDGGTTTLNNCIVTNNYVKGFDGVGGGGIRTSGSMTLNNSTIRDNRTGSWGHGGGIFNVGIITITNSTISNNESGVKGGGIAQFEFLPGTTFLNNCTISGNSARSGGEGIYNGGGTITVQNTILHDCQGEIVSSGYNLTTGCTFAVNTGDLFDINPLLFPLMGSPGYHPLTYFSPAVDAGNPDGCRDNQNNLLTTDQRGSTKPLDGNGDGSVVCDIGSYEYDPNSDPLSYNFLPFIQSK